MRTAAACAPLVVAVLLAAESAGAVDRVARSSEVVVRERPGSSNPGIAILKRGDRVRFFGERDGWTEVGLPDGRSGWVPSAEIAPVVEPPPPNVSAERSGGPAPSPTAPGRVGETMPTAAGPSPTAKARATEASPTAAGPSPTPRLRRTEVASPAAPSPTTKPWASEAAVAAVMPSPTTKPRATETATAPTPAARTRASDPVPTAPVPRADAEGPLVEHGRALARVETEIGELRRSVDRLTAAPPETRSDAGATRQRWTSSEGLLACAVTFVIGVIVGSVVQRRRARRERTLRF